MARSILTPLTITTGGNTITSSAAASVPLVLKGAASQSGSLLSFQNDSGTVIGNFTAPVNNVPRLNLGSTDLGATVGINGHATGGVTLAIKAIASQTADMQQWINSGNSVLAKVDQNGFAVFGGATVLSNSVLSVSPYGTTQVGLTIKATSGQSANLQNWQDSTPTTVTSINSAGLFSTTRNITIAETNAGENALVIRAASNHTGYLTLWQNSSSVNVAGINAPGQVWTGSSLPVNGSTTVAINTQTPTGTTNITITTAAAHGISVGQNVTIAGITPSGYNGNWIAQSGTTGSTLVVNIGSNPGAITVAGTVAQSAQISSTPSSTNATGLVIKALASHAANLFEVQSSTGSVLARIASTGQFLAPSIVGSAFQITSGGVFSNGSTSAPANTQAYFLTTAATNVGLVVRGAASQSADTFQIQNSSGTVLAKVDSGGVISTSSFYNFTNSTNGIAVQGTYALRFNGTLSNFGTGTVTGTKVAITNDTAGNTGLRVQGAASQTANLQEWQDSSGNVLLAITSSGGIGTSGLTAIRIDANRNVALNSNSGSYGNGQAVTFIGNATTAPTANPTGGGVLFVETGALKYRGTSGSAATIVNADGTMSGGGGSFTGGTLTSNLTLAAGTTSLSPLTFQSGTNLTTVTAGANEYDGTVFYQTSNTNPGRALATQNYYYASSSSWLPDFFNSGSVQGMLGGATKGITLAAGTTYEYELYATVQHQFISNTGVTGTYQMVSSTVSGSPTVAVVHQVDYGSNTTNFTTATTLTTVRTTGTVVFSAAISSGSRYNFLRAKGIIRVTGTGTAKVYPGISTSQVGASDNIWTVQEGLVFKLTPIGNGTATTVGTWA